MILTMKDDNINGDSYNKNNSIIQSYSAEDSMLLQENDGGL